MLAFKNGELDVIMEMALGENDISYLDLSSKSRCN
jgi:hypothetical protein